jgi:uncharacterized protein (DUF305 family)
MKKRTLAALAAIALTASGYAIAQSDGMAGMNHADMNMGEAMGGYMAAMDTMMISMGDLQSSGDADADFLLMMIPHHQSAIDMAKVELEHGDDDATREMAEKIIAAQESEIAQMKSMLQAMGVETPKTSN